MRFIMQSLYLMSCRSTDSVLINVGVHTAETFTSLKVVLIC